MKSKIENCLYMQVAHCNKCGGQSGYNIIDGEKVCFDCGEPYEADFSVSKVETTITTTNSQDQEENEPEKVYVDPIVPDFIAEKLAEERYNTREILLNGTKPLEVEDTPEEKEEWEEELGKLMSTWGKVLFVNKGRIGAGMQTAMYLKFYHFIKQLLLDREREAQIEVLTEIFQVCYQEDSKTLELVEEKLSKLTTK